jgi:hypothetical protein
MFVPFTLAGVTLLASSTPALTLETHALLSKQGPTEVAPFSVIKEFDLAIREVEKEPRLICKGCNDNESRTLAFLQDRGITDKNALATIMGNIRQESTFVPNICEGGARTSYWGCRSGGYGLIQFTCAGRYNGLGQHASSIGKDPSTLEAQLSYIVTEHQWKSVESKFKTQGKSIESYMNDAYRWIGWGHHGARTSYAYDYARRMTMAEVTM